MSPIWYIIIHTWILKVYETNEVYAIRLDSQEGCQMFVIHPKEINHTVLMFKFWLHEPEVSNNKNYIKNYNNSYSCSLPACDYMVTLIIIIYARSQLLTCQFVNLTRAIYLSNFPVMCSHLLLVNLLSEYHSLRCSHS